MKKSFSASVNDQFQFHLSEEEKISFQKAEGNRIRGFDGRDAVDCNLIESDFASKKYSFRIHATHYEVSLKNELQLLIDELGLAVAVSSVSNELKAPIPGLITDILVEPGASVKEGEGLLILEAMKMENKLTSDHDGVIKSIAVKKGDTVEKGMILIEFENNETNP